MLWLCFTSPPALAWKVVGCSGLGNGWAPRRLSCGEWSPFMPAALGAARSSGAAGSGGETASLKSCTKRYDCCMRVLAGDSVWAEPPGGPSSLHPPGSGSDLPCALLCGAWLALRLCECCLVTSIAWKHNSFSFRAQPRYPLLHGGAAVEEPPGRCRHCWWVCRCWGTALTRGLARQAGAGQGPA